MADLTLQGGILPEGRERGAADREGILFVMPWDLRPIGGVDGVVANLYEQFASHGRWKPLLLIHSWADKKPTFVQENGYEKLRVRIRGPLEGKSLVRALFSYLLVLPYELRKVAAIVRNFRVGVVNAHYPTLGMVNVALARRLGLVNPKLVLSLHGTDIRKAAEGNALQKALWRWLLRQADAVVAVSERLARVAENFEPRIRSRLHVVHNGLDADHFVALAAVADASVGQVEGGKRVLLSVGAFDWNKGHDVLLRAFDQLANRNPDLHLVLVGQTGPQMAEIGALVESLGLGERCTLVRDASREIVARWMAVATVFALASRTEGFGLVFLEAGAFGLPVVATRVGGIPEIICGAKYGVLVDPDDAAAVAAAIEGLLEDPEAASRMGNRLRERVRSIFSWEQAYQKYDRLLAGLTADGAR